MDETNYILLCFIAFKGLDCSLDGNGCDVRKPHKYDSNDFMEFAPNVNFDLHNTFRLSNSHHDVEGKTKKNLYLFDWCLSFHENQLHGNFHLCIL